MSKEKRPREESAAEDTNKIVSKRLLQNRNGGYVAAEGEPSFQCWVVSDGGLVRRLEDTGEVRSIRIVGCRRDPVLSSCLESSRGDGNLNHLAAGAERGNLGGMAAGDQRANVIATITVQTKIHETGT